MEVGWWRGEPRAAPRQRAVRRHLHDGPRARRRLHRSGAPSAPPPPHLHLVVYLFLSLINLCVYLSPFLEGGPGARRRCRPLPAALGRALGRVWPPVQRGSIGKRCHPGLTGLSPSPAGPSPGSSCLLPPRARGIRGSAWKDGCGVRGSGWMSLF